MINVSPNESGARAVPLAWTVRDSKGELLPHFSAGFSAGCRPQDRAAPYDAFRLEVSPSYREPFDRDLKAVLAREDWRIVPLRRRNRKRRRKAGQLELKLN